MTSRRVSIECPYCGYKNRVLITVISVDTRIVTCDLEDGGCDSKFVADCKVSITVTARKIEGEGMTSLLPPPVQEDEFESPSEAIHRDCCNAIHENTGDHSDGEC